MRVRRTIRHKNVSRRKKAKVAKRTSEVKDWTAMDVFATEPVGLGPGAGGQSGDIEGLPAVAFGDSESVAELVEEGQDLEAEQVSGVENAPDPDEAEANEEAFEAEA